VMWENAKQTTTSWLIFINDSMAVATYMPHQHDRTWKDTTHRRDRQKSPSVQVCSRRHWPSLPEWCRTNQCWVLIQAKRKGGRWCCFIGVSRAVWETLLGMPNPVVTDAVPMWMRSSVPAALGLLDLHRCWPWRRCGRADCARGGG
jgi:hypothetical protein